MKKYFSLMPGTVIHTAVYTM